MCSDLKNLKKMFYFSFITQESDPVQMYRIVINGLSSFKGAEGGGSRVMSATNGYQDNQRVKCL